MQTPHTPDPLLDNHLTMSRQLFQVKDQIYASPEVYLQLLSDYLSSLSRQGQVILEMIHQVSEELESTSVHPPKY